MLENSADGGILFGRCLALYLTVPGFQMELHRTWDPAVFGRSEREAEIVTQIAQGLSNREIAERLCLCQGTVRSYISIVFEKLCLRTGTQVAVFYYRHL